MAFRTGATMKIQSITVPQPFWGSWITAIVAGALVPTQNIVTVTLGTACNAGNDAAQLFQPGDPVWIIDPNGANGEACVVQRVNGNNLTLNPQTDSGNWVLRNNHVAGAFGVGSFILLGSDVNNFFFQYEDGALGQWLYLGTQFNMTAAFRRIVKLSKVTANSQPFNFNASENFFGAPFRISELWVLGTNVGDQYNSSLGVL